MQTIGIAMIVGLLSVGLFSSAAMACNCGKKSADGSQVSSCQHQCGESCGAGSCSDTPLKVNNTHCPVSGRPIGSMGDPVSYVHNGQTYQLCCASCIDQFKADPEKYLQQKQQEG